MNPKPFIVEFTGTPDSGKTSTIESLVSRLELKGLKTFYIPEIAKKMPTGIDRKKWNGYLWIRLKMLLEVMEVTSINKYDIILIDRGLYDGLFWLELFYKDCRCSKKQYTSMKNFLLNCFPIIPDMLLVFYVSSEESITRKLLSGNTNIDESFISFYNSLLLKFYDSINNQEKKFINTTNMTLNNTIEFTENIILKGYKDADN